MPHLQSLPFPELPEEVQGLDPVETVPFFKPIMQNYELFGIVLEIMAKSFLADRVVFL